MKHPIPQFLLAVALVCCLCADGFCQGKTAEVKEEQPIVRVVFSETTEATPEKSTLTLTLEIESGVAIFTNEPNPSKTEDIWIPTTLELLDQQGKINDAAFQFPPGIRVEMGDFNVYTGAVKITATFPAGRSPEKLKLKYNHAYRYHSSVEFGFC